MLLELDHLAAGSYSELICSGLSCQSNEARQHIRPTEQHATQTHIPLIRLISSPPLNIETPAAAESFRKR